MPNLKGESFLSINNYRGQKVNTDRRLFSMITYQNKRWKKKCIAGTKKLDEEHHRSSPTLEGKIDSEFHPSIIVCLVHFFLGTPSLRRKSSSMRGRPSRSLIFGSHPNNSLALEMSGFLCRGSSGVLSTIFITTSGLISCNIEPLSIYQSIRAKITTQLNWNPLYFTTMF